MRNVETFDAVRRARQPQSGFQRLGNGLGFRFHDAEALLKGVARIFFHQLEQSALLPALRGENLHAPAAAFGENLLQRLAILEIERHMQKPRLVSGIKIDLLQQRGHEFLRLENLLVFPVEITAIDHAPAAQVKKIDGYQRRLGVPGQHVGVIAFGGSHFLAFVEVLQGAYQVPQRCRLFVHFAAGGLLHAALKTEQQVVSPAFQKHFHVARGLRKTIVGGQAHDAGSQAAVDVILQAGAGMHAQQVHGATGNLEPFVNQMNDAIGQAGREVGAKIDRAIFLQAPGDVDARIFFVRRVFNVRVGLIVAQQHVKLGLVLLNEIIFERQSFALVVHHNRFDVGHHLHQSVRAGMGLTRVGEIGAHPGTQRPSLADVHHRRAGIAEEVHSGLQRKIAEFFFESHYQLDANWTRGSRE